MTAESLAVLQQYRECNQAPLAQCGAWSRTRALLAAHGQSARRDLKA